MNFCVAFRRLELGLVGEWMEQTVETRNKSVHLSGHPSPNQKEIFFSEIALTAGKRGRRSVRNSRRQPPQTRSQTPHKRLFQELSRARVREPEAAHID